MIRFYKQFDLARVGGIGRISFREVQFCQNNDNFGIYSDLWANLNQGVSSYGGKLGDGSYILIEAPAHLVRTGQAERDGARSGQ